MQIKKEIETLIDNISNKNRPTSEILHKALLIAKNTKDVELEGWIKLEINGYFNTNPFLTEATVVPEYRTVSGLYCDIYNRPLLIDDNKLQFINTTRLRNGISELENFKTKYGSFMKIVEAESLNLVREFLKVEVHYFSFPTASIDSILDQIRIELLDKIIQKETMILESKSSVKSVIGEISELVISDKLEDALSLIELSMGENTEFSKEIILHRARLREINRNERINISPSSELEIQRIKLRAAILSLSDHIK
jgi:hypothetical protein